MRTLTYETGAWVHRDRLSLAMGDSPDSITFTPFDHDMSKMGYVCVGEMTVTVRVEDDNTLRAAVADTLRAEIDKVRGEAQNRITELTRKLNEVLAIECEVQA